MRLNRYPFILPILIYNDIIFVWFFAEACESNITSIMPGMAYFNTLTCQIWNNNLLNHIRTLKRPLSLPRRKGETFGGVQGDYICGRENFGWRIGSWPIKAGSGLNVSVFNKWIRIRHVFAQTLSSTKILNTKTSSIR